MPQTEPHLMKSTKNTLRVQLSSIISHFPPCCCFPFPQFQGGWVGIHLLSSQHLQFFKFRCNCDLLPQLLTFGNRSVSCSFLTDIPQWPCLQVLFVRVGLLPCSSFPSVVPNCLASELGPNHTPLPPVASLSLTSRAPIFLFRFSSTWFVG